MKSSPGTMMRVLRHLALLIAIAIVTLPLLWIGLAAFKTQIALLMGELKFSLF